MSDFAGAAGLGLAAPRKRSYFIAALVVPIIFAALLIWVLSEYRYAETLRLEVTQSYERRLALFTLKSRIGDAETAQRGYLLTHKLALLEPLDPALRDIRTQLAAIETAADKMGRAGSGRERVATHVPHIAHMIEAMVVELDHTVVLTRAGHGAEALRSVSTGAARGIMTALAVEIAREIDREAAWSNARAAAFTLQRARLLHLILLAVAAAVAITFGLLTLLWNTAVRRHGAILRAFEIAKGSSTFFDSTIGAVLILGPSGKIEVMNAAAVALLGYFADERSRRDISTIVDIAPGEGSFHQRLGLVDGQLQHPQLTDRVIRDRTGRDIPVDVALGVLHAADGDRVVVSLRDISERKRLDGVKDELMSTVTHEIRTPLTSIVGSLGLLRTGIAGALPAGATRLVDIAENNSRRLIRLIDDMLDIDRIESGKLRIARETIDLREVLDQAGIGSEGMARDRCVTLSCATPDAAVLVSGDADRLLQVVSNLASNAIRVAPVESTVELSLEFDDAGNARVVIADRGPGVPLAFRTRIFGRFERAARDDGAKGTGLGLAISREIVTLHGGRLWFEDRPGGGTCFVFTLSLLDRSQARERVPRALICCDDDALCGMLVATVAGAGWTYDIERLCARAQAAIAAHRHAMVLVDLDLPGGEALALAQTVRDHDPASEVSILLVSARAHDDDRIAALDLIDAIDASGHDERLGAALRTGIARGGGDAPVVLHLADDVDMIAAVAVVAARLAPGVRMVAARDMPAVRALFAAAAPDVVVFDPARAGDLAPSLLPFLLDAQGRAIPTILYAARALQPERVGGAAPVLVAPPGVRPDLLATLQRALPAHFARKAA